MKKRSICLLLAVLLALFPVISFAEEEPTPAPDIPFDYNAVTTPHIIVIDAGDAGASHPIYERAADEQIFPASTTKILTSIVALENADLDMPVTVGEEIRGLYELKKGYTENSSLMGLVIGETLTLRDLFYGLMLVSGNEAADAIAVAVGGSIEHFVEMMNAKAQELGMTNSHFMNPNGVNHEKHYSTARDMAKLTAYALQNAEFAAICSTPKYIVPANGVRTNDLILVNSNLLLTAEASPQYASMPYEYCIGVKTGLTTKAGSCLIAAAEKDGARAIVCLYGDDMNNKNARFINAKAIFNDVFANSYAMITSDELSLTTEFRCKIENAQPDNVDENGELTLTTDVTGFVISGLPEEIETLRNHPELIKAEIKWTSGSTLSAPVHQGQLLGTAEYSYNGNIIYSADLIAPHDVLEVALVASEVVSAADGGAPSESLLATPEPVVTDITNEKGPLPSIVKIIIGIVAALLVIALILFVFLYIRKQQRRKRRAEAMRRRRLSEQRAASLKHRSSADVTRAQATVRSTRTPSQIGGRVPSSGNAGATRRPRENEPRR